MIDNNKIIYTQHGKFKVVKETDEYVIYESADGVSALSDCQPASAQKIKPAAALVQDKRWRNGVDDISWMVHEEFYGPECFIREARMRGISIDAIQKTALKKGTTWPVAKMGKTFFE